MEGQTLLPKERDNTMTNTLLETMSQVSTQILLILLPILATYITIHGSRAMRAIEGSQWSKAISLMHSDIARRATDEITMAIQTGDIHDDNITDIIFHSLMTFQQSYMNRTGIKQLIPRTLLHDHVQAAIAQALKAQALKAPNKPPMNETVPHEQAPPPSS